MAWWIWEVAGCGLMGLEIATPGAFFYMFFGFGAMLTGALAGTHILAEPWEQWLFFAVTSAVLAAVFRGKLVRRFRGVPPKSDIDELVGQVAVAAEDIPPEAVGRVEMRGAAWSACNINSHVITAGQRCRVERVNGLVLDVRSETADPVAASAQQQGAEK